MTTLTIPMAIIVTSLALAALGFWIAMIRDCWLKTQPGSRERWVCLLIVILGKLPGAFAYYLLRDQLSSVRA